MDRLVLGIRFDTADAEKGSLGDFWLVDLEEYSTILYTGYANWEEF